jgi:nucleoside 2-deoxyribosyltransferase
MKVYLAASLFSESELSYNEMIYDELRMVGIEVYAPQKNTAINDKTKSADSVAIFRGDTEKLEWADAIVALLDGPVVDAGVAAEIGYMAAKGKKIYGLLTDSREPSRTSNDAKKALLSSTAESQFAYVNLYVVGAVKANGNIYTSFDDLYEAICKDAGVAPRTAEIWTAEEGQYFFDEINKAMEPQKSPANKAKATKKKPAAKSKKKGKR